MPSVQSSVGTALIYGVLVYLAVRLYEWVRGFKGPQPWYRDKEYLAVFAFVFTLIGLLGRVSYKSRSISSISSPPFKKGQIIDFNKLPLN